MSWLSQDSSSAVRKEALNLYERALSEGNPAPLHQFLEQYLAMSPPPFDLLYDIADDLQQRQIALRGYYFDVRDNVVQAFQKTYQLDIARFSPAEQLFRYHLRDAHSLITQIQQSGHFFSEGETHLMHRMLESSLQICAGVYRDIQLTRQLQDMLEDWLTAYQTVFIRQEQYWDVLEIDASLWLQ
jgi:hypothetical protein